MNIHLTLVCLVLTAVHNAQSSSTRLLPYIAGALATIQLARYPFQHAQGVSARAEQLMPPSPLLEAWARAQISPLPGAHNVNIKIGNEPSLFAVLYPNTIVIDSDIAGGIEERLQHSQIDEKMAYARFCLSHEMGHLHHQDVSPAKKMVPLVLGHGIVLQRLQRFCARHITPRSLLRNGARVLTTFALGQILGGLLSGAFQNYKEARADRFACTRTADASVLRGAATYIEQQWHPVLIASLPQQYQGITGALNETAMLKDFQASHPLAQSLRARWASWCDDPIHPYAPARAQQLRATADALDASKEKA